MGEARWKAAKLANARKTGEVPSDDAFLREAERRREEVLGSYSSDTKVRPTVLEAVDIDEALEHPVFGRLVAYAWRIAEAVAKGEPTAHPGAACMTCSATWTTERMPVVAVIGTIAGKEMAGMVCEACAEVGQERFLEEKLRPVLPPNEDGQEPRLIRPMPGGSA